MDDAAGPAHRIERGRPFAVPDQIGIAIVLEDRHAILRCELQELGAARLRHDGAGRVLHGRDDVDVYRLDAEPRQSVQRALIGLPLDNNGVAARQQRRVDEVERLQRAGDDQDIVGDAVDAGIALELCRQKFAKRTVALRTAGKPIGGQRLALASENRVCSVDQAFDRDLLGVVVAADKTVFREPRPPCRRSGQSRREQWREVEC